MRWQWLLWQVGVPILGPIAMSIVVTIFWWTTKSSFSINWPLILEDMTPWALIFYALTLIATTLQDLFPRLSERPGLGSALIVLAVLDAMYGSIIVVSRQDDPKFTPGAAVYVVTLFLLVVSIGLCHQEAEG